MQNDKASKTVAALEAAETIENFGDGLTLSAENDVDEEHTEPLYYEEGKVELEDVGEADIDVHLVIFGACLVILEGVIWFLFNHYVRLIANLGSFVLRIVLFWMP